MAKSIKISKEVIATLLPQRNLLNAPEGELMGQTFLLNSVVESDDYDESNERIEGPVRFRFINTKNNTIMAFPVRGLLFSEHTTVTDPAKYDHKTSKRAPLHQVLLEKAASAEDVDIPEKFTVMHVEARKTADDKHEVYPTYSYKAFQERVDNMKEGEEITDIYRDFDFMRSLPGGEIAERFQDPHIEPVKNIVISLG